MEKQKKAIEIHNLQQLVKEEKFRREFVDNTIKINRENNKTKIITNRKGLNPIVGKNLVENNKVVGRVVNLDQMKESLFRFRYNDNYEVDDDNNIDDNNISVSDSKSEIDNNLLLTSSSIIKNTKVENNCKLKEDKNNNENYNDNKDKIDSIINQTQDKERVNKKEFI